MRKKKFFLFKIAAFLVTAAPFLIDARGCGISWLGEPELPAKYECSKKDT